MAEDTRAAKDINKALLQCPMPDRLTALMLSVVSDEPRARYAICDLISVSGVLARQLSAADRLAIAWHMLSEIELLNAKWN
jgi:hypothetical protein